MKECLPFLDLDLDAVIVFKYLLVHTNISFKNATLIYLTLFFLLNQCCRRIKIKYSLCLIMGNFTVDHRRLCLFP